MAASCTYHLPAREKIFIKMDSIKSRSAMGLENILFPGVFVQLFRLEILQAGAVKELTFLSKIPKVP